VNPDGNNVLLPGTLFQGRYRVVRAIKAGSMGAVYEVVDHKTESRRALKVMLPGLVDDQDMRARFVQEARITGAIESDHLVRVLDAGVDDRTGTPFLVMDLLRGDEIGRIVKRDGPLTHADVASFLFQAAIALDKTHAAGIVHRDLKPQNLFLTYRDDGSPCVKLLDFGIAKVLAPREAHVTKALGTPLYMAPEQVRGDISLGPRVDIYALGQIAYTLLTGEPYWNEELKAAGTIYPLLSRIVDGVKEPPSTRAARRNHVALPPGFDDWFLKATASKPQHRFEWASEAVAALSDLLGSPSPAPALDQRTQKRTTGSFGEPRGREPGAERGSSPELGALDAGTVLAAAPAAASVDREGAADDINAACASLLPPDLGRGSVPTIDATLGVERASRSGLLPRVGMSMDALVNVPSPLRRIAAFVAVVGALAACAALVATSALLRGNAPSEPDGVAAADPSAPRAAPQSMGPAPAAAVQASTVSPGSASSARSDVAGARPASAISAAVVQQRAPQQRGPAGGATRPPKRSIY
jgi:tRNA A-37 threonylcarbamoyl transferase component Bud32